MRLKSSEHLESNNQGNPQDGTFTIKIPIPIRCEAFKMDMLPIARLAHGAIIGHPTLNQIWLSGKKNPG